MVARLGRLSGHGFLDFDAQNLICYSLGSTFMATILMQYPLHTVSQPVTGDEARKLARAIKLGQSIANPAAIATAKRIAKRRKRAEKAHATER
jgi:hypothetical protein